MPPARRALFQRWIDDAAVFPPGNAAVADAWGGHLALRAGRYADLLGPLLVGTSHVAELLGVAAGAPGPGPVGVGVIARAGTPVGELVQAVRSVRSSPQLELAGVEPAHDGDGSWRRVLDLELEPTTRVAVEVPREAAAGQAALEEVATAAATAGTVLLAKLRTQATGSAPPPTPQELAGFLLGARSAGLPLKLTGGLHRALAHEEEHGALNVLLAVHQLEQGATLDELVATLQVRQASVLAPLARDLDEDAVARLRSRFVSFGCCGVLDPVQDLVALGLLD